MSLLPYASLTHRRKGFRATADIVLLSSQTADGDNLISFLTLDWFSSTYCELIFKWYNINGVTDANEMGISFSTNSDGSTADYNQSAVTSTAFAASHPESDSSTSLSYETGRDLAQATSSKAVTMNTGSGSDESSSGEFHFFNPSSTTYVKHFWGRDASYGDDSSINDLHFAGYVNTTTAINGVKFDMQVGGAFDGKIKLWGVKA